MTHKRRIDEVVEMIAREMAKACYLLNPEYWKMESGMSIDRFCDEYFPMYLSHARAVLINVIHKNNL